MKSTKTSSNEQAVQQTSQLKNLPLNHASQGIEDLQNMELVKVIGTNTRNNNQIQVNPVNGDLAYPAGGFIVIYCPRENLQRCFLKSRSNRAFQCLHYSSDGKYLAAGERAFRQPEVTIWQINQSTNVYTEIKHLKGHKYGIELIRFSPLGDYLITLGDPNDRGLFLWDWQQETRVTSNKLSKPVVTLEFNENQEFFVTAGYQHLKYWFFDPETKKVVAKTKDNIMESKTAELAKVKCKVFVGVGCKEDLVYALAKDGHIYMFDKNRKLLKWMNIKVERAFSCSIANDTITCACSDGIIRLFETKTLSHKQTVPKPPPLGSTNMQAGVNKVTITQSKDSKFADVISAVIDTKNNRLVATYSDKMFFIWDMKDIKRMSLYRMFMTHNGPIHEIQYIPNSYKVGFSKDAKLEKLSQEMNVTKFMTCSSDRTIRFWHYIDPQTPNQKRTEITNQLVRNAYCKDMSKVIFVKQDSINLNDPQDKKVVAESYNHFKAKALDRNDDGTPITNEDATVNNEVERSIRCVKCSPDGAHLASGDWNGNIRIYDLNSDQCDEIKCIEAHDSMVNCLAYSPQINKDTKDSTLKPRYWLASGSRDSLIQVFDQSENYEAIAVLEHHTSAIKALGFNEQFTLEKKSARSAKEFVRNINFISCAADQTMVVRRINMPQVNKSTLIDIQMLDDTEQVFPVLDQQLSQNKILSLDISDQSQHVVTGHDKLIKLWQAADFKPVWEKKPQTLRKNDKQLQLKVLIDPYASILISSSSDKQVTIYEAASGKEICKAHCGEVTTAMCLSSNLRHMITTSEEGLIYFWRLPENLSRALNKIRSDAIKMRQEMQRIPQVIPEEDEMATDNEESFRRTGAGDQSFTAKQLSQDISVQLHESMNDQSSIEQSKKAQEIDDILSQISKANNIIGNLGNLSNPEKEPPKAVQVLQPLPTMGKKDSNPLNNLANQADDMPRWAQSTVNADGNYSISGGFPMVNQSNVFQAAKDQQIIQKPANEVIAVSQITPTNIEALEDNSEMENIFNQNLEMANKGRLGTNQASEQIKDFNQKILDDSGDSDSALDKEEVAVKEQIKKRQYTRMYVDESETTPATQKSQDLANMNRRSISNSYFLKKSRQSLAMRASASDSNKGLQNQVRNDGSQPTQVEEPQSTPADGTNIEVQDIFSDADLVQSQIRPVSVVTTNNNDANSSSSKATPRDNNKVNSFIGSEKQSSTGQSNSNGPQRSKWGASAAANNSNLPSKSPRYGGNNDRNDLELLEDFNTGMTPVQQDKPKHQAALEASIQPAKTFEEDDEDFDFNISPRKKNIIQVPNNPQLFERDAQLDAQKKPFGNIKQVMDPTRQQTVVHLDDDIEDIQEEILNEETPIETMLNASQRQKREAPKPAETDQSTSSLVLQGDNTTDIAMSNQLEEVALNNTLQQEMKKINESLATINALLNKQKSTPTQMQAQNRSHNAPRMSVRNEVTNELTRSVSLWNETMVKLDQQTSIDVADIARQSSMEPQTNLSIMGSQQQSVYSLSSQVSIKEDARDLLEKYSNELLQQFQQKLVASVQFKDPTTTNTTKHQGGTK